MDLEQTAAETMERMREFNEAIYRILEKHIERARLALGNLPYDPWYFSHFVRYHSCVDIDALRLSGVALQRAMHPMSGIEVLYNGSRVKVWKANDGELPIPGQSSSRQQFLLQPEILIRTYPLVFRVPPKLAIIWDVDSSLQITQMDLVCPKNFENPWKSAGHHFIKPIPHPATGITLETKFTEEPTELEIEIERKKVDSERGND